FRPGPPATTSSTSPPRSTGRSPRWKPTRASSPAGRTGRRRSASGPTKRGRRPATSSPKASSGSRSSELESLQFYIGERRPDVQLGAHPPQHLLGELRGGGVPAQVGCPNSVRDCFQRRFIDRARGEVRPLPRQIGR